MLKKLRPTKTLAGPERATALAVLLRELDERDKLLRTVKPLLPDHVRSHCSQAQIDGDCLRLFADSPVWAAKLRLCTQEILRALRKRGLALKQCQIRVCPPLVAAPASRHGIDSDHPQHTHLSAAAASHLKQAALGVQDPCIAACFERIARHHQSDAKAPDTRQPDVRKPNTVKPGTTS
ncbi:DciA family protein [Thiorhodovibrio frisius]|uniref:DUF721 domain-containing protein n=1 Tax=Thiorhodovibrio frisius TaxID=631362 RepID=H8Z3H5_9GAMM|nr:DciA family protein [Thiorhodovibrio frisius]EIC21883.1 Protein of unknown function (DUF721) [Thiorhodovibrio frisius]WPL24172.1 hypothetical protein Thiofri_04386 [Thiorhodovibrio frisius]